MQHIPERGKMDGQLNPPAYHCLTLAPSGPPPSRQICLCTIPVFLLSGIPKHFVVTLSFFNAFLEGWHQHQLPFIFYSLIINFLFVVFLYQSCVIFIYTYMHV